MSLCESNLLLNTKYVENIEKKYSKILIGKVKLNCIK